MKRFLSFSVITLLASMVCYAQFVFQVPVKDAVTRHAINAKGKLYLRGDSATTFVANVFANENNGGILNVIIGANDSQEYVLEIIGTEMVQGDNGRKRMVESDKYDAEWVTLQRTPDMNSPVQYPDVYMNIHRENKLREVTVTASKVMFYNKGDTLIYNADAFVLAEGSTLDALLGQMPGVELRSNGVIYCDGQRVDNLLLNGKDLFNGKKELMLQNLAAYTVKDIAVYDKSGRLDELMGIDTGDKTHVMDVRLKRQYSNGCILNAEAGYGTHNRYLGKLFGMWFSDNVSVSLFGGANNLSDASTPGAKDGAWSSSRMGEGVSKRENGGLTYFVKGSNDAWELKGNVDAMHNTENNDITSVRENFLSTGNTFEYLWRNALNKAFNITTRHTAFTKLGSRANLTVTPSFSYRKNDREGSSVSAVFNEQIAEISRSRVQQIYELVPDLASIILNRDMREWMSTGKEYNSGLSAKADLKMSNNNLVSFVLSGSYNHSESERQNRFEQNEGQSAIPSAKQSQYFKNYPDHTLNMTGRMSYTKYLQFHMVQLPVWYEVHHRAQTHTSELYLLDELAGHTFTETLPSMTQVLPVMDVNNSYMSKERILEHTVGIAPGHSVGFEVNTDYLFSIMCNASIMASRCNFEYYKGTNSIDETRTFWLPQASINIMFQSITRKTWNYHIDAMVNSTAPTMINLVDLPVTDPLNRVLGNTNLTPSNIYTLKFRADRSDTKKRKHLFSAEYSNTRNALARGYYYNILTGQKTYRTYNVDGNMRANVSYEFFFPFGKSRQYNFTTTTRGIYNRSVDLIGTYADNIDFSAVTPRNIVNSFTASEKLSFNWQVGKHRLTVFADARLNRYTSSDIGFADFTSWICNYGASAVLNLPQNWGISTDLTVYSRRGFVDSRLNNTEAVWNARISKSILKGSLIFVVDAYDILQQLNNITYTINAQARTETVSNVIPSYLLFHIYYRLNVNAKRR